MQQVWRDLKSRVSIKMRNRRKEMAQTGNKSLTTAPLSEFERKVIGLLGKEYIDGSLTCPDSLPEEEVRINLSFMSFAKHYFFF